MFDRNMDYMINLSGSIVRDVGAVDACHQLKVTGLMSAELVTKVSGFILDGSIAMDTLALQTSKVGSHRK